MIEKRNEKMKMGKQKKYRESGCRDEQYSNKGERRVNEEQY